MGLETGVVGLERRCENEQLWGKLVLLGTLPQWVERSGFVEEGWVGGGSCGVGTGR